MLEATPTAVKGLPQRARASLDRQHATGADPAPEPGSPAEAALAQRFADAFIAYDVDALVALLTDDAWMAMPPALHEYHGAEAIAGFPRASPARRAGRRRGLLSTRANAQPAFAFYLGQPDDPAAQPSGLAVLTLSGDRIAAITLFLDTDLPSIFGFANALVGPGAGKHVTTSPYSCSSPSDPDPAWLLAHGNPRCRSWGRRSSSSVTVEATPATGAPTLIGATVPFPSRAVSARSRPPAAPM